MIFSKSNKKTNYQLTFLILLTFSVFFVLPSVFPYFQNTSATYTITTVTKKTVGQSNGKDSFGDVVTHFCSLVTQKKSDKPFFEYRFYSSDITIVEDRCESTEINEKYVISHSTEKLNNFSIASHIIPFDHKKND